jgi:hypothetical protein
VWVTGEEERGLRSDSGDWAGSVEREKEDGESGPGNVVMDSEKYVHSPSGTS